MAVTGANRNGPVNDVETMQVFQSQKQLGAVEARTLLVEATFILEVPEELATVDKGKHKVQLGLRLEGELERHDEGVVDLREDHALCESVFDFVSGRDMSLADRLEGVDAAGIALPDLHDLKRSSQDSGAAVSGRGWLTRPKLPLPMTVSSSKLSMVNLRF